MQYESAYGAFATGRIIKGGDVDKSCVWSTQARILPYLEEEGANAIVDFEKHPNPDNSPARLLEIKTFRCPSDINRLADFPGHRHSSWGKNNYKCCTGNMPGIWDESAGEEAANGIFITNVFIALRDISDGTTKTAMMAEAKIGDGNANHIEIPGDWFRIDTSNTTRAQVYEACMNVVPQTGLSNQGSQSGQNWVWGNYNTTRYNHIMLPNDKSCVRASGTIDETSGWSVVNNGGGATTASSWHPGGVNVAMADGSVKFVEEHIDIVIWQGLGSIADGEVIPDSGW